MYTKEYLLKIGFVIDNEWLDSYIELVNKNINTKRTKYKTQRHHIIPRYFYKLNDLKINNSKENIVNLEYKDHILAHYFLAQCSKTDRYIFSNISAIQYILSKQNIPSYVLDDLKKFIDSLEKIQELYEYSMKQFSTEEYRKKISYTTKLAMKRPEVKEKMNKPHYNARGKKLTDEHKNKISIANKDKEPWNKNKKMNEEYCKIHSECQIGIPKIWTSEGLLSFTNKLRSNYKNKEDYKQIRCINTNKVYEFAIDAAFDLFPNNSKKQNKIVAQHIIQCCKKERKTAYKYMWEYC